MNLLLLFDHRFSRAQNGAIFADKAYHYSFFSSRYLQVFDRVHILARVADSTAPESPVEPTEGPGVNMLPLPNWKGPLGFLCNRSAVLSNAMRALIEHWAVIMIAPGGTGTLTFDRFRKLGYPVALEVVSDPWEAFQPGAVNHPLRPVLRRWLATTLRKQCAAACAASYVTNQFLQERYPCPNFSVGVSDVVLPRSAFLSSARQYAASRRLSLIYVGVMSHWYKGHDVLLETLANCVAANIEVDLVLVGDGPLRGEIERRAERRGIRSHIRFTGQLSPGPAVQQELDKADLFVLPSRSEGLPRALIEAMARALPCIASNVGGVPELLETDALVPGGDAHALTVKLRSLVSQGGKLSEMSGRNLLKASEFDEASLQYKRLGFYKYVKETTEQYISSGRSTLETAPPA